MENAKRHDVDTPTRLLVRVLQDLVARETFATYADLTEALKLRCGRLKIPYHGGLIAEAIAQLERGGKTPLIAAPFAQRTEPIDRREDRPPSHEEAVETLQRLGIAVGVRTMRPATWHDPAQVTADYEAARERAAEMGIELTLEDFLR